MLTFTKSAPPPLDLRRRCRRRRHRRHPPAPPAPPAPPHPHPRRRRASATGNRSKSSRLSRRSSCRRSRHCGRRHNRPARPSPAARQPTSAPPVAACQSRREGAAHSGRGLAAQVGHFDAVARVRRCAARNLSSGHPVARTTRRRPHHAHRTLDHGYDDPFDRPYGYTPAAGGDVCRTATATAPHFCRRAESCRLVASTVNPPDLNRSPWVAGNRLLSLD